MTFQYRLSKQALSSGFKCSLSLRPLIFLAIGFLTLVGKGSKGALWLSKLELCSKPCYHVLVKYSV